MGLVLGLGLEPFSLESKPGSGVGSMNNCRVEKRPALVLMFMVSWRCRSGDLGLALNTVH